MRESKRFAPSRCSSYLVPLLLAGLVLGLLATLAIIFLAILGLTPGS